MWLDVKRRYPVQVLDPTELVVPCRVDVREVGDDAMSGEDFSVGRFLADELRRHEIEEHGLNVWTVADADSSGLEAAWSCLLDEQGEIREDDFDGIVASVVYCYRFALHPDFVEWRLAVIDSFCRMFDEALILMQFHTTLCSDTEFAMLGFKPVEIATFAPDVGPGRLDRQTRFMLRNNNLKVPFKLSDYPDDFPTAKPEHEAWLESQAKWDKLC